MALPLRFSCPSIVFLLVASLSGALAQLPKITSFSPASGAVGTTVTIAGTGFNATAASNVVYFGSVKAAVTAASATQLLVRVPGRHPLSNDRSGD